MSLTNAKHIITEIDGIRCSVVETGVPIERAAFLRDLLEFNNLDVREIQMPSETPEAEPKYTIAVTDILFNPVFAVYECLLKNREGKYVSPGYWNQECTECDNRYWLKKTRKIKSTT